MEKCVWKGQTKTISNQYLGNLSPQLFLTSKLLSLNCLRRGIVLHFHLEYEWMIYVKERF